MPFDPARFPDALTIGRAWREVAECGIALSVAVVRAEGTMLDRAAINERVRGWSHAALQFGMAQSPLIAGVIGGVVLIILTR